MKKNGPHVDPTHYVWGLFYHNPEDPALMVPMRYGSGIDFNYARWPGRTVVLLLALGLVVLLVSLLS